MDEQQTVYFQDIGMMGYQDAWDYQEQLLSSNVAVKAASWQKEEPASKETAGTRHHLLFTEHPPVYTLGKSGNIQHILISEEDRRKKNIDFFHINRGGDITFHGPGQLVVYPILDLEKFSRDIGKYLRHLEEVVIRCLADFGIHGDRSAGETGVWIDAGIKGRERKVCAIGIRCSRWITMHGFAFNVNTNLDYFSNIIPCGIQHKQVTSLKKELGEEVDLNVVKQLIKKHFCDVFEVRLLEKDYAT